MHIFQIHIMFSQSGMSNATLAAREDLETMDLLQMELHT